MVTANTDRKTFRTTLSVYTTYAWWDFTLDFSATMAPNPSNNIVLFKDYNKDIKFAS